MAEQYALTPTQVAVLRVLGDAVAEVSAVEVALGARLLLHEARAALESLKSLKLVQSWPSRPDLNGDEFFSLVHEGQSVFRALGQFKEAPPVGTIVRVPRPLPSFSQWLSGQRFSSSVEIVAEDVRQ